MNQSMEAEGPVSPVKSVLGCYPVDGWGGGEALVVDGRVVASLECQAEGGSFIQY